MDVLSVNIRQDTPNLTRSARFISSAG